jgi:flagellar biosynthesis protein FliR
MTFNILEGYLTGQLFAVLVIFTRVSAALMVMPGFSESYVFSRAKLVLCFLLSVALAPFLEQFLPPIPQDPARLAVLLLGEIFVGLLIGTVARFLMGTMHVAGMIISFQSSLSIATQFDPTQAAQGTVLGNFLSVAALTFIFSLNLHHMMLRGVTDSYSLIVPGNFPPVADIADYLAQLLSKVFEIGVQLAAPSIVIGLLLNLVAGIISRLMPNMQVFFVMMPVQLMLSFFVMMIVFQMMMTEFAQFFSETFSDFLEGL